jgi:hypothetical protein
VDASWQSECLSRCGRAAVDDALGTGDACGLVRGEVQHAIGDVDRLADVANREAFAKLLEYLAVDARVLSQSCFFASVGICKPLNS